MFFPFIRRHRVMCVHCRAYTCRALLCLLFALRDKGAALGTVLGRLVFPALIRTLSTAGSEQFVHPVTGMQMILFVVTPC